MKVLTPRGILVVTSLGVFAFCTPLLDEITFFLNNFYKIGLLRPQLRNSFIINL